MRQGGQPSRLNWSLAPSAAEKCWRREQTEAIGFLETRRSVDRSSRDEADDDLATSTARRAVTAKQAAGEARADTTAGKTHFV